MIAMNWFATYWLIPIDDLPVEKLTAPKSMWFKARSYSQALDKVYDPKQKKYAVKLMEIDHLPKDTREKFKVLKIYPELKQW